MAAKEAGDIASLLSTDERDFLVNSNGEKVVPLFPTLEYLATPILSSLVYVFWDYFYIFVFNISSAMQTGCLVPLSRFPSQIFKGKRWLCTSRAPTSGPAPSSLRCSPKLKGSSRKSDRASRLCKCSWTLRSSLTMKP